MKAEVDLSEDRVVIIKKGELHNVKPSTGYGKVNVVIDGDKVDKWSVDTSYK